MIPQVYTIGEIAAICHGEFHASGDGQQTIHDLLIDSRRLIHTDHCLFIALVSERNDGHRFIPDLYAKGVRNFMVSYFPDRFENYPGTAFVLVENTLTALQQLGAYHRHRFNIPVIGVTGSNGKTVVKEWLFQLLGQDYKVIRSPKSYNSQIGVPLSVWKMAPENDLAIFEAGISRPDEMVHLERIISPTIGIFTNIGHAHDEYFGSQEQKVSEKLKLFTHSDTLIYCSDYELINDTLKDDPVFQNLKTFTWSRSREADLQVMSVAKERDKAHLGFVYRGTSFALTIPFSDDASIENAIHCLAAQIVLTGLSRVTRHASRFSTLAPIAMRLELKEAINHCSLINDSYNSDINALSIALDFLNQQSQHESKTVILSDILQTGREKGALYTEIASMLASRSIRRIIGIGRDLVKHADKFGMEGCFFTTTDEFLQQFPVSTFQNETILLKGARLFEFEKISQMLQQRAHETVMEINLDALVYNLNFFRSGLKPATRTMAMVKAFSYGNGSFEIANVLQFHRVDYLAVAYADEGVELRKAGIHLPVMVMSPEEHSLDTLLKYNLEPEIYNIHILNLLEDAIRRNQTSIQQEVLIHLKLDTGMHRLGFSWEEIDLLIDRLKHSSSLRVQSIFTHLAASEDPKEDDFTRRQIEDFKEMSSAILRTLDYPVLMHALNSAGISRFPEAQFDMVRLGIGLYGVGTNPEEQLKLRNVSTLKSVITQIKHIPAGDSIGYNRRGKAETDKVIAIVPVGYADGLDRRLGNGRGKVYIHGKAAPIIGNICMDLTMVDITNLHLTDEDTSSTQPPAVTRHPSRLTSEASRVTRHASRIFEGDEVIIFGDAHPVSALAHEIGTIPYEVLTGISRRVKRIYYYE